MAQSSARKASLQKATKAAADKRTRVVEERKSKMAELIQERWGLKETSANHLMAAFKISRSTLARDMEDLIKRGLIPRRFRLRTRRQINAENIKATQEEKIRNYVGEGFNNVEISRKLHISDQKVGRLIEGMKKRGDRRLITALEYIKHMKMLKIIRERETWVPVLKLTDQTKALEEELGESLESRNFKNMVTFNLEELEAMRDGRELGMATTARKHLLRAGILTKGGAPRRRHPTTSRIYVSEKALQLMEVLRTSETEPQELTI